MWIKKKRKGRKEEEEIEKDEFRKGRKGRIEEEGKERWRGKEVRDAEDLGGKGEEKEK